MPDYKKSKIYKVHSASTTDEYVGSTTQDLVHRFAEHKSDYKGWLAGKRHYMTSFEITKFDDAIITLVQDFPCDTAEQLIEREKYYIRNNENAVNKQLAIQDVEELKAKAKAYNKIYQVVNKEKRKEQAKKRKEKQGQTTCECGSTVLTVRLSLHHKTIKHLNYINSIKVT
jgi:hypothetical protein